MTALTTNAADLILREYHRRLTHITKHQPYNVSQQSAQLQGELIGLRGALGIALGGQVRGGKADRLAATRYAEWQDSAEAAAASCTCDMCTEVDAT